MYKQKNISYDGVPYYRYFYTIKDLILLSGGETKLFSATPLATLVTNNFTDYVGDGYYKNGTYANNIWQRIVSKYETNYIYESPFELNMTTYKEQVFNGFKKIISRMEENSYRYDKLLAKLYEANLDLFGRVKSKTKNSNINKFNDTPQIENSLDDDKFASNISKNNGEIENETDGENIVERISNYQDKMNNILDDWCSDFNELFIESLNID